MSAALLQLDQVTRRLGDRDFAFDLVFDQPAIVAVLGPSGAGKTTLLNLVAGYEQPDSGRVLMDGRDVTDWHPGVRPVSLVFQDHNLFGHMSVADNVGLGLSPALRLTEADKARINESLRDVGLGGQGRRLPASLSGGERQRVAFARVMVRNRPILLLDEPFAALDHDLRVDMGDLLVALQHRLSCLVVMITHDEAEAERLAHRIVRIASGRVVSDIRR